jgi:hypothetical protein
LLEGGIDVGSNTGEVWRGRPRVVWIVGWGEQGSTVGGGVGVASLGGIEKFWICPRKVPAVALKRLDMTKVNSK